MNDLTPIEAEARRALSAVFLEVPESVGTDLHAKVYAALAEKDVEIKRLRAALREVDDRLQETGEEPHGWIRGEIRERLGGEP